MFNTGRSMSPDICLQHGNKATPTHFSKCIIILVLNVAYAFVDKDMYSFMHFEFTFN